MTHYEVESKYRLKNPSAMRTRLRRLRARKLRGGKEENIFWDTKPSLRKAGFALRLRRSGRQAWLTLKGRRLSEKPVRRFELETAVDFRTAHKMLVCLGYRVFACYTKRRDEFRLRGCKVTIDALKGCGNFLEIEGKASRIRSLEKELGLHPEDYERQSYLAMVLKKIRSGR